MPATDLTLTAAAAPGNTAGVAEPAGEIVLFPLPLAMGEIVPADAAVEEDTEGTTGTTAGDEAEGTAGADVITVEGVAEVTGTAALEEAAA